MKKNIHACIVTGILMICASCSKETATLSPSVVQSSSENLSQSSNKHFIGEYFGGGIVFYVDPSGKHGLIAASADFEEPTFWSQKDTLNGAKDTALGSGAVNTIKIYKIQGYPQYEADGYAALECMGLIQNGYQDWYLPSINELSKMYENKAIIGGFQNYSYWSSSEVNATKAWLKNFMNGSQLLQFKTARYALRPARKF
ncbi:MAG: DUF1566 domain-containing protein [Panacibacter sp.]